MYIDMESLSFNEYQKKAMRTCKKYDDVRDAYANIGLGLAGESGEVADLIKKHLSGAKEIDKQHLTEELGDILWYIAEACEFFNINMQTVAQKNIEKLEKRFPNGFDGYGNR